MVDWWVTLPPEVVRVTHDDAKRPQRPTYCVASSHVAAVHLWAMWIITTVSAAKVTQQPFHYIA